PGASAAAGGPASPAPSGATGGDAASASVAGASGFGGAAVASSGRAAAPAGSSLGGASLAPPPCGAAGRSSMDGAASGCSGAWPSGSLAWVTFSDDISGVGGWLLYRGFRRVPTLGFGRGAKSWGRRASARDGQMTILSAAAVDREPARGRRVLLVSAGHHSRCDLHEGLGHLGPGRRLHHRSAGVPPFPNARLDRDLPEQRRVRHLRHLLATPRTKQLMARLAAATHEIALVLDHPQNRD